MYTPLQSTKLYQTTISLAVLTTGDKTGTTTNLTTGAQPGVADGAYLQMGVMCYPN